MRLANGPYAALYLLLFPQTLRAAAIIFHVAGLDIAVQILRLHLIALSRIVDARRLRLPPSDRSP